MIQEMRQTLQCEKFQKQTDYRHMSILLLSNQNSQVIYRQWLLALADKCGKLNNFFKKGKVIIIQESLKHTRLVLNSLVPFSHVARLTQAPDSHVARLTSICYHTSPWFITSAKFLHKRQIPPPLLPLFLVPTCCCLHSIWQ